MKQMYYTQQLKYFLKVNMNKWWLISDNQSGEVTTIVYLFIQPTWCSTFNVKNNNNKTEIIL